MRSRRCVLLVVLLCAAAFAADAKPTQGRSHKAASRALPVTTASPQARKLFESGMAKLESWRQSDALEDWRAATRIDPNFALAHLFIAYASDHPEEESRALDRAKQLSSRVSKGEQLLVGWLSGVREGNYVPAIAALNDLLALYPDDKRVNFLAGRWMVQQRRYEQAQMLLERAVSSDPSYAAAVNLLGYAYAETYKFDKAFAMMERYVALQPEEPNPHDSYGEILRLAGRYDAALEQYRLSIKLDPAFGSTIGVADTYALMGREQEARDEYERALLFTRSDRERVGIETQLAITYIRENKYKLANHALGVVVKHAHQAGLAKLEAEGHRIMAMYEPQPSGALRHLEEAERALNERHQIAQADRDDELALVLYTRASRAATYNRQVAEKATRQLETMAGSSRSQILQHAWHGAAGALLMAEENYREAIPHLAEDDLNPISLRLLWQAYGQTGKQAEAEQVQAKLGGFNQVTAEQALVIPHFREAMAEKVRQR